MATTIVIPSAESAANVSQNSRRETGSTPVVGSSSGEIPNLIQKSEGGLIFPEKNAEEFATCLRALMTQNEVRAKYAENDRKWVEREVSLAAVARKMAHTLESVTGRARQKG